jgi:WD40 repeat protein
VAAVAWQASGDWIVAAERGPNLAFFEPDGKPVRTLNLAPESLRCLAVSPRTGMTAVGTHSGSILLFDRRGNAAGRLASGSTVWCLAAAGDGRTLVSGHRDGKLRVWDTEEMRLRRTIQAHEKGVLALAIEPVTQRLVSGGQDGLVRVFRTK